LAKGPAFLGLMAVEKEKLPPKQIFFLNSKLFNNPPPLLMALPLRFIFFGFPYNKPKKLSSVNERDSSFKHPVREKRQNTNS